MPDGGDYHAFNSTSGGSGGGSSGGGGGFGCATWVVIGIVAFFLISFIADGASWIICRRSIFVFKIRTLNEKNLIASKCALLYMLPS